MTDGFNIFMTIPQAVCTQYILANLLSFTEKPVEVKKKGFSFSKLYLKSLGCFK